MKYRIVKRLTGDVRLPHRFIAQRKGLFGWKNITWLSWSYNYADAKDYIHVDIEKRKFTKAAVPPDEVMEVLET